MVVYRVAAGGCRQLHRQLSIVEQPRHPGCQRPEVTGRDELTIQQLLELADAGHAPARVTWERIVRYGAWAALAVCHAVNPDVLVIGGGLTAAGDRLLRPLAEAVQAELATGSGLVVGIRRSTLGDDAALAGAAAFAAATAWLSPMASTSRAARAQA